MLVVRGIAKTFDSADNSQPVRALSDVSLEVKEGNSRREDRPDGQRRFPGFLGIGVANAMCEDYVGHGHFGVRRLERVVFHGSFKPGDTLHAKGSVVQKDAGSHPDTGTVTFNIRLYNQAEQPVVEFEPVFTMPKRRGPP